MKKKKPNCRRTWVYLNTEDDRRLAALLVKFPHLKESTLLSNLSSNALRACEANHYAGIPVGFTIIDPG